MSSSNCNSPSSYDEPNSNSNCNCNQNNPTISAFQPHEEHIPLSEYEKLRDEYMNVFKEKNILENELSNYVDLKLQYNTLLNDTNVLKDLNEQLTDKITSIELQLKIYQEQIAKHTKDREELITTITSLREQIKLIENEKTEIKIQNAHHLSKFRYMEKEITQLKKKNATFTLNIKSLIQKNANDNEDKKILMNNYQTQIADLENQITLLHEEKKKITKDAMTAFIESIVNKSNIVTFTYIKTKNKIAIKYANELIGEVYNYDNDSKQCNQNENESPNDVNKKEYLKYNEASVFHYKQQLYNAECSGCSGNNMIMKSPQARGNCSLKNLFSNNGFSISSRKDFDDKENKNFVNLNLISLNADSFVEKLKGENDDNDNDDDCCSSSNNKKSISIMKCINNANIGNNNNNNTLCLNEVKVYEVEYEGVGKTYGNGIEVCKGEGFEFEKIMKQINQKKTIEAIVKEEIQLLYEKETMCNDVNDDDINEMEVNEKKKTTCAQCITF